MDNLFSQYWHLIRNNGLTHAGELYSANALKDAKTRRASRTAGRFQGRARSAAERRQTLSLQALRVFEEVNGDERDAVPWSATPTYVDFALFDALFDIGEGLDARFAEAVPPSSIAASSPIAWRASSL